LYFSKDAPELPHVERSSSKRDGYLQRLYKNQLEEETIERKGRVTCMVEDLDYPALIASHIKPLSKTKGAESFDPNNGLLLSKNFDSLFDLGYIYFDDTGKVIVSSKLSKPLKKHLLKYYINNDFLNKNRKKYLKYHRENELIK
jgi:hypothetical protein